MRLEDIIKLIIDKGYLFQISIPNRSFSHGRITIAQALIDSASLQDYFNKIIRNNSAENLLVKVFTPNGSSVKNRGEYLISLAYTQPVATVQKTETPVATNTTPTLQGAIESQQQKSSSKNSMDVNDQIEYKVLQVKHEMLLNQKNELDQKVKDLTKKVDTLQDEKLELVKSQAVSKEKHELEVERARFAAEKESKDGLSGIVDFAENNPETIKMLVGLFKPDHPMFKNEEMNGASNTPALESGPVKYHSDPEINVVLQDLPNTIKTLSGEQIAKIYMVFLKFKENPESIETVHSLLHTN